MTGSQYWDLFECRWVHYTRQAAREETEATVPKPREEPPIEVPAPSVPA